MRIRHRFRVLCSVLFVLAISGLEAVAADNGDERTSAGSGTSATATSSEPIRQADTWFDRDKLDLNVYGLAYHPDRDTVHRQNLDNEFNPGLGLHYELDNDAKSITFAEIGFYKDSGDNWSKFAALGYQFKLGEYWRVGGALAAMHSRTYNRGVTFVAMIPLLTLDLGRIKLNAVYFPKFGNYNKVDAFGFYLSIPFGGAGG